MLQAAIREVMAVGRARGVRLDDGVLDDALQMMRTMPEGAKLLDARGFQRPAPGAAVGSAARWCGSGASSAAPMPRSTSS